ncbi:MAG: 16S rRNA (cytosine(967)-C(5))-methyltransferase RsmB [Desulfuromonadales bacterium]|nr:16S rRNA (cytosine(967)-C(5))-methyltransferase RsmB [Desulfuromonadales bacterium]
MADNRQGIEPRRLAFAILTRVDEGGFADLVLDGELRRSTLDLRDRSLVTELVYGTLRLRGRLDFALDQVSRQPLRRLEPGVLRLLRLGAYQLLELDRVPAHAAVNASVMLARQLGMERVAGLVNGTLRGLERMRQEIPWPPPEQIKPYLQHVCSLPGWLAKELLRQFPNVESRAFGEALAGQAPYALRVNRLKTDRDSLLAELAATGHLARPARYAPDGVIVERRSGADLPGDEDGWYQIQDEASMLIAHLLDAQPGMRILDACAAPGGKTTHLAALTANRSPILALEKHAHRVELIRRSADRLGCTAVEARTWDLTEPPEFLEPQSFDRVLVDAPCSGLGVLRRNPESRWNRTAADARELAGLQATILDQVAPLVRVGGVLLYSVCTFTTSETTAVVADFLARHKEYELDGLGQAVPEHWRELIGPDGMLHTFPHRHDGMDAFFAARLRRR